MVKHHSSTQNVKVAVDAGIFTIKENQLCVLLIQMKKAPFEGKWALPGGIIDEDETTLQAATRILKAQTAMDDVFLEQLATFDDVERDPAGRVISVAHYALVPDMGIELKTTDKYMDVRWVEVHNLPPLAYDHKHIVHGALERISGKIQYTNVAWSLLPKEFTLTDLQTVYEVILGKKLDKRNFRKRILDLGLIKSTNKKQKGMAHRPAKLYTFVHKDLKHVQIM